MFEVANKMTKVKVVNPFTGVKVEKYRTDSVLEEPEKTEVAAQETEEQARVRFLHNYCTRCADPSLAWFNENVGVLVAIAVPAPRPSHPRKRREPREAPLPWGAMVGTFEEANEAEQVEALV